MDQKSIEISVVDVTFNQAGGINTPDQRHRYRSFLRGRKLCCRCGARRRKRNETHVENFITKHQISRGEGKFSCPVYWKLNLTINLIKRPTDRGSNKSFVFWRSNINATDRIKSMQYSRENFRIYKEFDARRATYSRELQRMYRVQKTQTYPL